MTRIYLDNAATSWPKPESVYQAAEQAARINGAPAGRGGYQQVVDALRLVQQTRGLIAGFINSPNRRNVSFSFNGTDSLSTAIFGLLGPGDHVISSVVEHNSVLRPLKYLESQGTEVTLVGCDELGRFSSDDVKSAIKPNTKMICLIHASNVTGAIQSLAGIKEVCDERSIIFVLDAAQSLGHVPIDVQEIGCDILAAPGHKGLLAPLGTGMLYVKEEIAAAVRPLRFGGTGTFNSLEQQPDQWPDKFESGNLNVPGIAGLNAGLKFLKSDEGQERLARSHELTRDLIQGLSQLDGLRIYGPQDCVDRIGVVSFAIEGIDCHEVAHILDSNWSVQTRSGLHCAPLLHRALGTEGQGGLVRMSLGLFNTTKHVQVALNGLSEIVQQSIIGN